MIDAGLFTRLEVTAGHDNDVERLLQSVLPRVAEERATAAWFAVRFGRSEYAIVDAFANRQTAATHLAGPVGHELMSGGGRFLGKPPHVERFDVLAHKLPPTLGEPPTKAFLLTFDAKQGRDTDVEAFLVHARGIVEDEPKTVAWFAMRFAHGGYGIFDAFPDNAGRFAHLTGGVPRELAKRGLSLLGSMPEMHLLDVVSAKIDFPRELAFAK